MAPSKLLLEIDHGTFLLKRAFNEGKNWRSDHSYKFIYSLDGTIHYQTNRSEVTFQNNEFIIFNPLDEHKQLAVNGGKFLIELNPTFLNQISQDLNLAQSGVQFALSTQKNEQISKWVKFIIDFVQIEKDDQNSISFFLDHSFTQFALLLLKNTVGTHTKDINLNAYQTISPQIYHTIQALKEAYSHSWTLDEMAEIARLNKFQFAHHFKEITGFSPYSWLQIYRIVRSQEMLKKTNKTVLSIAMDCGFSSVSVYNQLFKRLYGMSPRAFRNQYKINS